MDDKIKILNMSDPVKVAGECLSHVAIQARQTLKGRYGRESSRAIIMTLDTSQQKFQSWKKQWIENHDVKLEVLWGEQGWADIKVLLATIKEKVDNIESHKSYRQKPRSSSRSRLARALSNMPGKDGMSSVSEVGSLLVLGMDLSGSIDQLWTYSEVTFDSQHGLLSKKIGTPSKEKFLIDSERARSGCLALYRACTNSGLDCNLDVDLSGPRSKAQSSPVSGERSLRTPSKLYYHVYTQTRDAREESREIILESLPKAGSQRDASVDFDSDIVDLRAFESTSKSDVIRIHSQSMVAPSYFRVSKPSTVLKSALNDKTLVQILKEDQSIDTTIIPRPTSVKRMELAFRLAECCFYLLGTPWLAGLSSQRIRKLEVGEHQQPFVLEIRTLDIEDLAFEEPEALTETTQLFRLGVLLMEIALNKSGHSDPTLSKEPYLEISKRLPLVEQSMGNEYCKATTFCLQDRRSAPRFGIPDKYRNPFETGWNTYLTKLLADYHSEVYLRYVPHISRLEIAGYESQHRADLT